jgi:hypothetical protein
VGGSYRSPARAHSVNAQRRDRHELDGPEEIEDLAMLSVFFVLALLLPVRLLRLVRRRGYRWWAAAAASTGPCLPGASLLAAGLSSSAFGAIAVATLAQLLLTVLTYASLQRWLPVRKPAVAHAGG